MRPTKEQVAEKEAACWNLRQTGATIRRIGAELGIPHTTAQAALKRTYRRVLSRMEAEIQADKVAQLHQLDEIIDEALRAWHRSKAPALSKSMKRGRGDGGPFDITESATQETRCGDVAYLEQARAALADKRKITGMDAPTKTAQTNTAGDAAARSPNGGGTSCP